MRGFLDPASALAFRCSRRWFDLRATASEKVRHCDGCRREVHWCASDKELEAHAERGDCVAIDPVYAREAAGAPPALGEPISPEDFPYCDERGDPADRRPARFRRRAG